ncbi:hypothetical protein CerSpe_216530 [Prunus speciosa]
MDVRFRRSTRETSPDRAKACSMQTQMQPRLNNKPIKKHQVVYYLSRNGHLEHPHYMEITHLANRPLRLRDVMDRLTALRGKGMPSLYSWSCKRSYKNGYVWNDLAENDTIYPAEGAEYVLKGSELLEGCSAERLDQLQISSSQQIQDTNFESKRRSPLAPTRNRREHDHQHSENKYLITKYPHQDHDPDQDYDEQEEEEDYEDEKTSYTSSTTPHSRCSRGVSTTDELEEPPQTRKAPTESAHPEPSPPPNPSIILSNQPSQTTSLSERFEDGDPVAVSTSKSSVQSRNSVLLQLIACGSSAVAKAKNAPCVKQHTVYNTPFEKKSSESFRKEVVYKAAVKVVAEEDMINYMSENPRFGNLQAEEKEYFSGSIVESIKEDRISAERALKRSNSYNEERSTKAGLEAETVEEEKREKAGVKGKCIPRKLSSAVSKQTRK